ncbi:PREDICTED: F-box protein At1g30790-like [Camelina sativa]|uniref:F-box protein At1g30790-like n=1 Tax=Camelina sativa TaxID=90675 RepID=A0ABM0TUM7_CAMSA|nr:PREDICTED: F-box protein At1g30790-like [Camelina sativa]
MKLKGRECNSTSDHSDSIPDDMTLEILGRLPGKSLMKFQYLSKFWFSIIRSQRFIDSFFSRSLNRGPRLLITFKNGELISRNTQKRLFFFSASREGEQKSSSTLVANLDMTIASTVNYCYTRGTLVHGFLCCSHQGRFLICNPTTRQIVTLPEPGDNNKLTFKYLGYEPVDDQYKALCMMFSRGDFGDVEHKVLTLRRGDTKNLSWREIKDNTEPYGPSTKGICIDGIVYYGATRPNNRDKVIVCFDVRFEKISLINPPFNEEMWDHGADLMNYKGKLAFVGLADDFYNNQMIILWILDNVEKHEWSKITCQLRGSGLCHSKIRSYSFTGSSKTGEIILAPQLLSRKLEPFYILYYNVTSQGIRRVRLEGIADNEEFRRRYGIGKNGDCRVYMASEYFEDIAFL